MEYPFRIRASPATIDRWMMDEEASCGDSHHDHPGGDPHHPHVVLARHRYSIEVQTEVESIHLMASADHWASYYESEGLEGMGPTGASANVARALARIRFELYPSRFEPEGR